MSQLDIFPVIKELDKRNFELYREFDQDADLKKELKQALSYLLPMWMVGATREEAHEELIENFNDFANKGWFNFHAHPELQAKLLAATGTGKPVKHKFYKGKTKTKNTALFEFVCQIHPDLDEDSFRVWVRTTDSDWFSEILQMAGKQPDEVKELQKQYDSFRGTL